MDAMFCTETYIQMHANPAAAEATILSLNQSPRPYQACQFILENSELANARFLAAGAIRDAAIREWSFLETDYKKSLIWFCWLFIMKHSGSHEGYVQAKVASVAAQLLKRGWLDFTAAEKEAVFLELVALSSLVFIVIRPKLGFTYSFLVPGLELSLDVVSAVSSIVGPWFASISSLRLSSP
ncbi:exportin-4 isoform X3 [Olea europaea subsp. europaea]|uniref:Exportin-4 n=1 Tax=Olea europaea subsp. europaea TaxID=158383 RepID=A0A8S0RUX8_OLEEU|nr:exportin-4 isoform X3 [Olea europaea subsp. europaea]